MDQKQKGKNGYDQECKVITNERVKAYETKC